MFGTLPDSNTSDKRPARPRLKGQGRWRNANGNDELFIVTLYSKATSSLFNYARVLEGTTLKTREVQPMLV